MTLLQRRGLLLLCLALALPAVATAAPPWETRDQIICRASSGVGFSYWWGGGCWCQSGCSPNWACDPGGCSGSCPSCSHWGSYGADCSGFTSKTWQVPSSQATNYCDHGPYVAASYTSSSSYWSVISRSSALKADAFASSSHVLVYESGDPWGWLWAYEARGCSYGIVHNSRTCSNSYSAARRINISDCECSPGAVETVGCGNCGTQSRTCSPDCHWGGWSSCAGQGPCSPGASEIQACCDCGAQSRSCGGNCQWGGWGGCAGPDPAGGNNVCDTGEFGPCADGRERCVEGCLDCVRIYDPVAELCDTVDNDCNGAVDDGHPTEMGDPPPAYAARLEDGSYPASLEPGEDGLVWVEFANVGTEIWRYGDVFLGSVTAAQGSPSAFYLEGVWPAWNVAAVLEDDVPPGAAGFLSFDIGVPQEPGAQISEPFQLMAPGGEPMLCPWTDITLQVAVGGPPVVSPSGMEGAKTDAPAEAGGCTCQTWGPSRGTLPGSALGLALVLAWARRPRWRGRSARRCRAARGTQLCV